MASGKDGARDKSGGASGPESLPPREVRVARAETASLDRTVALSGTLAAQEEAELGPKVAGRLSTIAVDLGDNVRHGQVLARLSPTDFELRVRQATNALEQARAQLGLAPGDSRTVDPQETALVKQATANLTQARLTRDRMTRLFEQQLIPQQDLDAAEAAFQVAEGRYQEAIETARTRQALLGQRQSELEIARQQRSDSMVVAPFDGRIRERRASVGDYVAAGDPVLVIVRVHPLRLRLEVPEREAATVRVGQPVQLTVEGDPEPHTGRVARISPALTEESRTLLVEAEVPNPDGQLRPGSFAKAEIVTRSGEPTVLVPVSAVITFAGVEKVLGVEDGKAVEKRVRTGRRAGDRVEILEGAAAGDTVVLEPGNLVGGQPVTVVP
ncbi:MAG TPA: efflux RND transporter periplasmic adaptor subunit [Thermoanaerobaculia bacterium]|nr:efflux RND transporter periplasmic adaptor subunit [Thermoanaerobaculia bacterium]